jgi:predicted ester cyclase
LRVHGYDSFSQMTVEQVNEWFARRVRAFASHDPVALAADYTEDCVLYSPTAGTLIGRRGVERVYRLWFNALTDLKWEVDDLVIAGDRVASLNTFSGTDLGGFLGLPPPHMTRVRQCFADTWI